jgi:NAD(P)-dependent dehydrogenase (short-subunit alcohol dehydrogenase family)
MKTVIITGSTRGIGLGLAREFLKRGHNVVISGRSQSSVDSGLEKLSEFHKRVLGVPCQVHRYEQVQALWDLSIARFGKVDIWISNAGIANENALQPFWEAPPETLDEVTSTNLLGTMYCARVALAGFIKQDSGQLYNFEGFGSNGKMFRTGLTPYGATKSAIRYLTRGLAKEVTRTNVKVGALSPGIVLTDLLLSPYREHPQELTRAKKIFNILADQVETVTPYLVERVLENEKNGQIIEWLTTRKILGRFATAGLKKRDLFRESVAPLAANPARAANAGPPGE